ncbi:aminoglycoside phosphotransferase family protein [Streptomyces katsurahamanus]|uniref:Hydroxyurea phosphotransferase n=1 Tax=Streptomyces katsurahamanus TaxID=2577098 RepID=A0ABW9P2J8_9ACTN|nr:aminoglycoside phosphotransferase family protein [Streptomyces katsurahamanus]MQS39757.1 hydroxyurea phosphotransferase [Streptomyces katsurahamanus]
MTEVPEALAEAQRRYGGAAGRAFIELLPARAAAFLERWELRRTGDPMHGCVALALPVERADGTPAVLKLQTLDEESAGEPVALRAWGGDGAVRLLDHDPDTNTLLLERLDSSRHLSSVADSREAVRILAGLLARLTALPAPGGLRGLGGIAARMLDEAPGAARLLGDESERRLLLDCAAAVREVAGESGNRLLHWDLHYDNILAAEREPWLAIDPKPLAGDPGFELLPALRNRYDPAETRWRFDLLTEALGLDRARARVWTLGRVLQNSLWDLEDGERRLGADQREIARALLGRD